MIRSTGQTGHNCLNDNQVKILIKGQELKKTVETNIAQTEQELFKVVQDELSADKVPHNVVAADFTSLLHQSSGLHKRRAKTLPSVPKNFVELDITGQFALTTGGMPFLRYDNKSENNRIILLVCDKTLKILGDSKDWYMDGTFKCAPEQLLQMYSLHGRLDGNFLPCAYILMQTKDEKSYREAVGLLKDIAAEQNVILYIRKSILSKFISNYFANLDHIKSKIGLG